MPTWIEIIKLLNARPDWIRTTDQDHTDTRLYFTKWNVKFSDKVLKKEFSLSLVLSVASTAWAVIWMVITWWTSWAVWTIIWFNSTTLYVNNITWTFVNAETITSGAYSTTLTVVDGVGISWGKAVVRSVRASTAQFSLVPNKGLLPEFEAYISSDPTYQLRHAVKTLDVTWNKKVYIELPQANIEDWTLNTDVNWVWIAEIKSTASYPVHPNYVPLYEITWWLRQTATDLRQDFRLVWKSIDLSDYDWDINAVDITANTLTVNNIELNWDDLQDIIDDLENQISSWWNSVNVVLWENVVAWSEKWAVFFWQNTVDTYLDIFDQGNTETLFWQVDSNSRFWINFITPPSIERYSLLRKVSLDLRKIGNPWDNLEFRLFESDKVTPILWRTTQTLAWTALNTFYSTWNTYIDIDCQDILLDPTTAYFLEIRRSGAISWTDYFAIRTDWSSFTTRIGYATYTASTTTWSADDIRDVFANFQYWFNFTAWFVWKSDTRYESTNRRDWIIWTTGNQWDTRLMQLWGFKTGAWYINSDYWLNSEIWPVNIAQTQQITTDSTFTLFNWSDYVTAYAWLTTDYDVVLKTITVRLSRWSTWSVFRASLYSDNAWVPWTLLSSFDLSLSFSWSSVDQTFTMPNDYNIVAWVKYWLAIECVTAPAPVSVDISSTNVAPQDFATEWTSPVIPFALDNTKDLYYVINSGTSTSIDNITRQFADYNEAWLFQSSEPTNWVKPRLVAKYKSATEIKLFENDSNFENTNYIDYIKYEVASSLYNLSWSWLWSWSVITRTIKNPDDFMMDVRFAVSANLMSIVSLIEWSPDNINWTSIYWLGLFSTSETHDRSLIFKKWYIRLTVSGSGVWNWSADISYLWPKFILNKIW